MRKLISMTKDASIYEAYANINTGFDEIIEVGKLPNTSDIGTTSYLTSSVRILLNFATDSTWPSSAEYFLNLKIARGIDVKNSQQLIVGAISQSWDEGSGYFYQQPFNKDDGATWNSASMSTTWPSPGGYLNTSTTASYTIESYPIEDIRINVTNIMQPIISGSIPFYGLYIKFPTEDEQDSRNSGLIKFFATQTHTVHQPKLEVVWASQAFATGSLKRLPLDSPISITSNALISQYEQGTIEKIRLIVRDKFPDRAFNTNMRFANKYYLPSESYYRVVDITTGVGYGEFDQYNAIDCDATGSYFVLNTNPLYKNKEYAVEIKYLHNGNERYSTLPSHFIVR
jgi:hypothetical protein